jgi:hypothetical protein
MLRARFMVRRGALKFHRIYLSWEEIAAHIALVKACVCPSICTDGHDSRRVSDYWAMHIGGPRGQFGNHRTTG